MSCRGCYYHRYINNIDPEEDQTEYCHYLGVVLPYPAISCNRPKECDLTNEEYYQLVELDLKGLIHPQSSVGDEGWLRAYINSQKENSRLMRILRQNDIDYAQDIHPYKYKATLVEQEKIHNIFNEDYDLDNEIINHIKELIGHYENICKVLGDDEEDKCVIKNNSILSAYKELLKHILGDGKNENE